MASLIVKKRNEKWEYSFETSIVDGKRKRKSKSGFKTKKECLDAGNKALNEYNTTGRVFTVSDISLSDYFDFWLENYVRIHLKFTSYVTYANCCKNICKYIGDYKLSALTPGLIQKFINDYSKNSGFAKNHISSTLMCLKGALRYAVLPLEYLLSNPCDNVRLPKSKTVVKDKKKIVTYEEFLYMLSCIPDSKKFYRYFLIIGFFTGARYGEIMALEWKDIDFINKTITFKKTIYNDYQIKEGCHCSITTPKSVASNRTIYVADELIQKLKTLKVEQSENKLFYGDLYQDYKMIGDIVHEADRNEDCTKVDFVLRQDNGKIKFQANDYYRRKCKMPDFHFHLLRHSHATMLLQSGVNIKEIQMRLGHSEIATTLDIYAKSTEDTAKTAAAIFANFIASK